MSFDVAAESYGRFMGRYSEPLGELFAERAGVKPGQRVLDVGCGPGALTQQLVDRLGSDAVAAIDPSPPFVDAVRRRFPGVDVRTGVAEELPWPDATFDTTVAQLVVHFMEDPVAGLREMGRVTRPGGVVTACVWDNHGVRGPLSLFWQAARDVDPTVVGEGARAGSREGQLAELCEAAGLTGIESDSLTVKRVFATFEEWWDPFLLGVGPAGDHVASLDDEHRAAVRARCAQLLPPSPFIFSATAWNVRARTQEQAR